MILRDLVGRVRRSHTTRHSFFNLMGLGLPLIFAVIAIPVLIRALGVEAFGVLTIIWAVVSYFGLFDLGLGRALTQQVAICVAADDMPQLERVVGTALTLMLGLGGVSGVAMAAAAPWLARRMVDAAVQPDVTCALWWMAATMPAIVLTTGFRGMLEAVGRFGLVNAIRLPMGIFTYAAPVAVVWAGASSLAAISAVLCVGRILAAVVHGYFSLRALPRDASSICFERAHVASLFTMGGWITVTNIVSPIMNYADRFFIGVIASAQTVAFYATPQELVLRIGIIPTAITSVLFPSFASIMARDAKGELRSQLIRYTLVIAGILAPVTLILIWSARPLLTAWISVDFAAGATGILQIMAVAALCSGLAQVPFTMLQSRGRADQTAKLHLIQLPLYLGLLVVLVERWGAIGAAATWLTRIALDMAAMFYLCLHDLRRTARARPTVDDSSTLTSR